MTVSDATGSAKALVKGIALIDLLASHQKGLRLTDLVSGIDMSRATVVRLLNVLTEERLVRHSANGLYRLGPRAAIWGSKFLDALELREVASDVIAELAKISHETCHLGVREDRSVLYIDKVESHHSLRMVSRVGGMNPLHCTGLGKALLAFMSPEEFDRYTAQPLERRTENTIVAPEILRADLQRIRNRGYALDDVENEVGVRCIGSPVFDHKGELVASISLAGPTMRMTWERIEQLADPVMAAAHEISVRLGFEIERNKRPRATDE